MSTEETGAGFPEFDGLADDLSGLVTAMSAFDQTKAEFFDVCRIYFKAPCNGAGELVLSRSEQVVSRFQNTLEAILSSEPYADDKVNATANFMLGEDKMRVDKLKGIAGSDDFEYLDTDHATLTAQLHTLYFETLGDEPRFTNAIVEWFQEAQANDILRFSALAPPHSRIA